MTESDNCVPHELDRDQADDDTVFSFSIGGYCVLPRIRWSGVREEASEIGRRLKIRANQAARSLLAIATRIESSTGDEVERIHPTPVYEVHAQPALAETTQPPIAEQPNI